MIRDAVKNFLKIVLVFLLVVLLEEFSIATGSEVVTTKFYSVRGAILLVPENNLSNYGYFLLDTGVRFPVVDNILFTSILMDKSDLLGNKESLKERGFRDFLNIPELSEAKVLNEDLLPLSQRLGVRVLGIVPLYFPGYEVFLDFGRGVVQWRLFSSASQEKMKKTPFVKLNFSEETQNPQVLVILNDSACFMANVDLTRSECIGLPLGLLSRKGLEFKGMKFARFYGEKEVCYFKIDSMKIGDFKLKNPVGVASVDSKDIWVGTRFWRYLGIGINYELGKIYFLGEEKEFNEKEWSGVGVLLDKIGEEGWIVGVMEDSPALKSGVKAGDELVLINGRKVNTLSVEEILQLLNGEKGSKVSCVFKDRISKENKELMLVSEPLI